MKTTLYIPADLIQEAMRITTYRTKSETVRFALKELIRRKRVEEVIASAGTLHFSTNWKKARHER